jgi:hypothetical protein
MPSKQTNNDVIAIEELVNEIKQNLRLKAAAPTSIQGATAQTHNHLQYNPSINNNNNNNHKNEQYLQQPKLLHNHPHQQQLLSRKQRSRPSPYHIPCRSWSDNASVQKQNLQKSRKNDENNIEDPYELLQSLIKNNSLVKEAVRRLQLNASAYSRKQNLFYDSDEDNRSPSIVMMCQLES